MFSKNYKNVFQNRSCYYNKWWRIAELFSKNSSGKIIKIQKERIAKSNSYHSIIIQDELEKQIKQTSFLKKIRIQTLISPTINTINTKKKQSHSNPQPQNDKEDMHRSTHKRHAEFHSNSLIPWTMWRLLNRPYFKFLSIRRPAKLPQFGDRNAHSFRDLRAIS